MSNVCEFKRRVWITKKCRIEASERQKRKNDIYQGLIVYYSIILVIFSILNIKPNINAIESNQDTSIMLLIASITLSLFTMFVTSQNFLERHYQLKNNYIELDKIYARLDELEENKTNFSEELSNLKAQYANLLGVVENHEELDYQIVIYNSKEEFEKLSAENQKKIKCAIWWHKAGKIIVLLVSIVSPFFLNHFIELLEKFL